MTTIVLFLQETHVDRQFKICKIDHGSEQPLLCICVHKTVPYNPYYVFMYTKLYRYNPYVFMYTAVVLQ